MQTFEKKLGQYTLVETGINIHIHLKSELILLEDAQAILAIMSGIIKAAEHELLNIKEIEKPEDFIFIPEIEFSEGSLNISCSLSSISKWTDGTKQAAATVFGSVILAITAYINVSEPSEPSIPEDGSTIIERPVDNKPSLNDLSKLSKECKNLIHDTVKDSNHLLSKYQKDITANIEVKCEGASYKSEIHKK